jgi:hypothetical protein
MPTWHKRLQDVTFKRCNRGGARVTPDLGVGTLIASQRFGMPNDADIGRCTNDAGRLPPLLPYLVGAGVPAHGTRTVLDRSIIALATTALVLSPDAFRGDDITTLIGQVRHPRPRLRVLLTCEPQRLNAGLAPHGYSIPLLILPSSSFGWPILEAIRTHASALAS